MGIIFRQMLLLVSKNLKDIFVLTMKNKYIVIQILQIASIVQIMQAFVMNVGIVYIYRRIKSFVLKNACLRKLIFWTNLNAKEDQYPRVILVQVMD